jgi:Cu+-exporting ATPase
VVDPVCDMTIGPADAVGHPDYKGQTYYFSDSCLERFRANPAPFLEADGEISPAAAGPPVETDYTCPMDPEIRQTRPGAIQDAGDSTERSHFNS